ncbi:50S ribosomal protein L9, partial [Candidatus Woesearchaeota archaeon]|nr:50S ribosomal protein L9 [Candidatus Woesearchaeota archaeon]
MAKEVKVVFVKDLKGNAKLGQMKNVKLGFARNYLVPQGYALTVTKENLSLTSGLIKREEHRKANEKKAA